MDYYRLRRLHRCEIFQVCFEGMLLMTPVSCGAQVSRRKSARYQVFGRASKTDHVFEIAACSQSIVHRTPLIHDVRPQQRQDIQGEEGGILNLEPCNSFVSVVVMCYRCAGSHKDSRKECSGGCGQLIPLSELIPLCLPNVLRIIMYVGCLVLLRSKTTA
ncbi:unnamed protein product, partial [Ectocarpus sp. 12 AP-2014]